MSFYLEIVGISDTPLTLSLDSESNYLGSSSSSNLLIQHPEVSPTALQIDVRGAEVWVQNLNPYPIFVGEDELGVNAWAAWANDDALLLSQNVQLVLRKTVEVSPEQEEQEDEAKAKGKGWDAGKIIQIVIICICFTLAPIILFQDNSQVSGASATKSDFDFVDTVERLNEGVTNRGDKDLYNNPEVVSLRDQLQAARIAERRWSKSSPKLVLETYQRLGRHRLIRMEKVPSEFTAIVAQIEAIKVFRKERVAALKDK